MALLQYFKKIIPLTICILCNRENLIAQDLLYLYGSGSSPNLTIQSGANVYVGGGFVANSGAYGMQLDGNLYLGNTNGAITANWTDNMASTSILITSTGTVYLQSNNGQSVSGPTRFYDLYLNNSSANTSGIQMQSNLEVRNQLTFNDGLLCANSYSMLLSSNSASAVVIGASNTSTYSNSWIYASYSGGELDREVTANGTYDFPVGSSSAPQLFQAITSSTYSGITRLSASWESNISGGTSPISLTECGTSYNQLASGGEWHLRPANNGTYGSGTLSSGTLSLGAWNLSTFTGLVDNKFALLQRSNGNSLISGWQVPTPGCTSLASINTVGRTVTGNEAKRNNLTTYSDATSQWAIGMSLYVLPIELLSLAGYNQDEVNVLNWTTESEYNSDYFDVERSEDGVNFSSIGRVNASGFSTTAQNYSLTDFHPWQRMNYYRLKMFDQDNSYKYSNVILIMLSTVRPDEIVTVVGPNPVINEINMEFHSQQHESIAIDLTDELGRILSTQTNEIPAGASFFTLNVSHLPVAVYFLHIRHLEQNTSELFKIVKVD